MGHISRNHDQRTHFGCEPFIACLHLVSSFQDVIKFLVSIVHMQRHTVARHRGHFTDAVGALGLAARDAYGRAALRVVLQRWNKNGCWFRFLRSSIGRCVAGSAQPMALSPSAAGLPRSWPRIGEVVSRRALSWTERRCFPPPSTIAARIIQSTPRSAAAPFLISSSVQVRLTPTPSASQRSPPPYEPPLLCHDETKRVTDNAALLGHSTK